MIWLLATPATIAGRGLTALDIFSVGYKGNK